VRRGDWDGERGKGGSEVRVFCGIGSWKDGWGGVGGDGGRGARRVRGGRMCSGGRRGGREGGRKVLCSRRKGGE